MVQILSNVVFPPPEGIKLLQLNFFLCFFPLVAKTYLVDANKCTPMFEVNVSKHCDFPCLGYCGEKHRALGEIGKTEREGDATSKQFLKRDLPDVS